MKPPSLQFYVKDWKADTDGLSPAAKGAWIQICCTLHLADKRGRATRDVAAWARIIGCKPSEVDMLMREIINCECADVTFRNSRITVVSRRMDRERKEKEQNALRQSRHRASRKNNEKVTPPSAKTASASASATTKQQPKTASEMPEIPDYLKAVWPDWVASRKEQKKPLKPNTVRLQLKALAKVDEATAVLIVEYSAMNNYQGLIFDRFEKQNTKPKRTTAEILGIKPGE